MATAAERVANVSSLKLEPFQTGIEHLLAELERLTLALHMDILRLRAARLLNEDNFRGLYVAEEQVDATLYSRHHSPDSSPPEMQQLAMQKAEMERTIAARCAASGVLPLNQLAHLYSLSTFQRDALLLSIAPEVDTRFETLFSYAQNDVTRKRPTVGLMLRLLASNAADRLRLRSLFSPDGPLLQGPLIRFSDEAQERDFPFLSRSVRVEARIVDFLLEQSKLDSRLRTFTTCVHPARPLASLHLPEDLRQGLRHAGQVLQMEGGILFFQGASGAGKRAVAESLSAAAGRKLVVADLRHAQAVGMPFPEMISLLLRETRLLSANLLLTHADALPDELAPFHRKILADAMAAARLILFIASDAPSTLSEGELPCARSTFEFPVPCFSDRKSLWQEAIEATGCAADPGIPAALANQFALTGGQIYGACNMANTHARLRNQDPATLTRADFEAAARAQSSHGLRQRAQKITAVHDWTDLVLPQRTMQQLQDVCAAEQYRSVIYSEWGFDPRLMLGRGLSALFSGPSGTGKTMSAAIVARELGLDLYKIDLSSVVSKYIGETEKQLSQIFREARSSNAILFFDEADALFGKRAEVNDARDRYANVEVSYLLQKMEDYEGIVILATNFRNNIDDAFTRRIQYIVEFPLPEAPYRERIWRNLVPMSAPVASDVDFAFLGRQFEIAGGNIRNAVLAAAFLAAREGTEIHMRHFVLATSRELQKMGKLPSRSDFREYYDLTRERA
jgi:hypothetical protein